MLDIPATSQQEELRAQHASDKLKSLEYIKPESIGQKGWLEQPGHNNAGIYCIITHPH